MNLIILCLQVAAICSLTLLALRYGLQVMICWLCLLVISMNLFVLKQITLFGLNVTASDALAVGYLLGLNLIQEFFGAKLARKCIFISLFISCAFLILSQIHLLFLPNTFDTTQSHFQALLSPAPRIIGASLLSFVIVQFLDSMIFGFLKQKTAGAYLTARTALALILSETLDTLLFSFIGLYGIVPSIGAIICLSLVAKGVVIALSSPFVALSKRVAHV